MTNREGPSENNPVTYILMALIVMLLFGVIGRILGLDLWYIQNSPFGR